MSDTALKPTTTTTRVLVADDEPSLRFVLRETLEEIGYDGWVMGELSTYADTDATESCYVNRKYLASVGY